MTGLTEPSRVLQSTDGECRRIGVLGGGEGWHVQDLGRAARSRGVSLVLLDFTRLRAALGAQTEFHGSDHHLEALQLVIVRSMPRGSLEQVIFRMDFLQRLEAAGIAVVNPARALECAIDKYLSLARMAAAGIPVPRSQVCEDLDGARAAFEALGGDVVSKPLFGSEGRGVERLTSRAAFEAFAARAVEEDRVVYLQRFLRTGGVDYRVVVLDGRALGCMRRRSVDGWRTNVSLGGRAESVGLEPAIEDLALRAASVLGCRFAGVDIVREESGGLCVLEVNAVPGWRAFSKIVGVDVADLLLGVSIGEGSRA